VRIVGASVSLGANPKAWCPPESARRTNVERGARRLIATGGIIGIAVALGAILVGKTLPAGLSG
jgi:hypothetical protein